MGQEYDCDKPPYAVEAAVFDQRRYIVESDRYLPHLGRYVRLVAPQIEPTPRRERDALGRDRAQCVERLGQSGYAAEVHGARYDGVRATLGEHLPGAFALLLPALAVLGHLVPEIPGIERQVLKHEARRDVLATATARVAAYPQSRRVPAGRTALESHRRIESETAGPAPAPAFPHHRQRLVAARAAVLGQHYRVIEFPGVIAQPGHLGGQPQRSPDDVHPGTSLGFVGSDGATGCGCTD